jgi:hypothetical protein
MNIKPKNELCFVAPLDTKTQNRGLSANRIGASAVSTLLSFSPGPSGTPL